LPGIALCETAVVSYEEYSPSNAGTVAVPFSMVGVALPVPDVVDGGESSRNPPNRTEF